MSEVSFPIKDLKRRKIQTGLTLFGLTISVSTTIFLVIFGSNLGFEIALITSGKRLTSGFSSIFSHFILIVSVLNLLAGALITSFLVYLAMSERVRDIGVMKSIGCLKGSIRGYFITELSLLVFLGTTLGTFLGVGAYYGSINLLNVLGFSVSQVLSIWTVLFILLVLVVVSHIFGALPIMKAAGTKPTEALSTLYSLGTTFESGRDVPSKLGLAFKVAYRNLVRRKSVTVHAIVCLAVTMTFTTVTIAGGMIANQTTIGYVERAVGRDVLLVGHPDLVERYVNLLSQFFQAKELEPIDYLAPAFNISGSLELKLGDIPGVRRVDPRLVLEASVLEIPGIVPNPNDPLEAVWIGDSRSGDALILGVEPERVVNEWLVTGRVLDRVDEKSTIIGDSLALEMFDDAQNQSIKVFEEILDIVGVCLDPLNNGRVVYIPLDVLFAELGQTGHNLLLLKIDPSRRSQVLARIEGELSEENLESVELNEILGEHVNFLNHIWSFVMFLPLFSLVTAALCLLSYLMLSITGQQREFGIMRALGAKPKNIIRIVLTQSLLVTWTSGAIGIFVGIFVTFAFLIPEPVVTQITLVSVGSWLLLALSLLCVSSLYPAMKAVKRSIVSAIYSV